MGDHAGDSIVFVIGNDCDRAMPQQGVFKAEGKIIESIVRPMFGIARKARLFFRRYETLTSCV